MTSTSYGGYGEPRSSTTTRDGTVIFEATHSYAQVAGGLTKTAVTTRDYSQPEVVIRTTVNVSLAKVVLLTRQDGVSPSRDKAALAAVGRFMSSAGNFVTKVCLPRPLYALDSGCASALAVTAFAVFKWIGASSALVAAGSATGGMAWVPAMASYFVYTGGMIASVAHAASHCRR